jgi:hypothetical protein
MENHHFKIFLIGKPSISMGHLYHGYVTQPKANMGLDQRNIPWDLIKASLDETAETQIIRAIVQL